MLEDTHLTMLKGRIQSFPWEKLPSDHDRKRVHEILQSLVVSEAMSMGYAATTEIPVNYDDREGRMDVGWYDDQRLIAAFEIDGSVRKKSVKKLNNTGLNVQAVLISKSTNKSRIQSRVDERLTDDIEHIDARLYDHF